MQLSKIGKAIKKLTGKSPRFDLFDKLVVLGVVIALVLGAILLFRKPSVIQITIRLDQQEVFADNWSEKVGSRPWYTEQIEVGAEETDGLGNTKAVIKDVVVYDYSPNRQVAFVTADISTTYTRSTNTHSFKGRPVAIGERITLNPTNTTLKGIIVNTEGIEQARIPVTLEVTAILISNDPTFPNTTGVDQFIAEAIKSGEQIFAYDRDPIITVKQVNAKPALTVTTDAQGQLHNRPNPRKFDVTYILEVNGYELSGKYYLFDDVPISINSYIPLTFSDFSFFPTVSKIKKISK